MPRKLFDFFYYLTPIGRNDCRTGATTLFDSSSGRVWVASSACSGQITENSSYPLMPIIGKNGENKKEGRFRKFIFSWKNFNNFLALGDVIFTREICSPETFGGLQPIQGNPHKWVNLDHHKSITEDALIKTSSSKSRKLNWWVVTLHPFLLCTMGKSARWRVIEL